MNCRFEIARRRLLPAVCRCFFASLFFVFVFSQFASAAKKNGNRQSALIPFQNLCDQAERALDDGVPDVAVEKFRAALALAGDAKTRESISRPLARALLDAGRAQEALDVLQKIDGKNPTNIFLKAQALGMLKRWTEALPLLDALAKLPEFSAAAKLARSKILQAQGRASDAIALLESLDEPASATAKLELVDLLLDANQTEKAGAILQTIGADSFLEKKWTMAAQGRWMLASGSAVEALPVLQNLAKDPRGMPENLLVNVTLGITDAVLKLRGPEEADNVIEDFLWRYPQTAYLDSLFCRLDQIYALEKNPSASELQKWAEQSPGRRAAFARFYLAKMFARENKPNHALEELGKFSKQFPDHALAAQAQLLTGKIYFNAHQYDDALLAFEAAMRKTTTDSLRAEIEITAGAAHFARREFVLAANLFRSAARHDSKFAEIALFDSSLAWLYQGNYDRFLDDYKELSARFPSSDLRRELVLEEGLLQARAGDRRAEKTLKLFIRDFPDNPRVAEAHLALAEMTFLNSPRSGAAMAHGFIKAAYEEPHTSADSERAAYLAIFLADAQERRNDAETIRQCKNFIEQNAASKLLPEVRMKLGQIYFRSGDFANARTQFETLAGEAATSPLAEAALFLAAQSAMKMMGGANYDQAIETFEAVAKMNGPLKLYARQEQAIAKSKAGKEAEAIVIYDAILAAKPDEELRFASQCGKGDALFAMGAKNAKFFAEALKAFEQVGTDPEAPAPWRNQALYKKGKCLEKLGREDEALAVFYDVIEVQARSLAHPEYFWFYKAGFDAARLLEAQQKWKSAIGVYQKIASLDGPRAQEARTRASQLRLEHFIWEE